MLIFVLAGLPMVLTANEHKTTIKSFYIKPKVCIVEQGGNCQRYFLFGWHLSHNEEACLYRGLSSKPIRCVTSQSAELELPLNVRHNESFTLRVNDSRVERKIVVRKLGKDVRQGTRHLWSVF